MSVREQVPKAFRGPVGFASLGVMILGVAGGYVLALLGTTLYFGLNGLGEAVTQTEAMTVAFIGVLMLVVGYVGWKSFNYFSY